MIRTIMEKNTRRCSTTCAAMASEQQASTYLDPAFNVPSIQLSGVLKSLTLLCTASPKAADPLEAWSSINDIERQFKNAMHAQKHNEDRRRSGRCAVYNFWFNSDQAFHPRPRIFDYTDFERSFAEEMEHISGSMEFEKGIKLEERFANEMEPISSIIEHPPSRGKLVILEDLGYDWIEKISSTFGVPINVFAEHWANLAHHNDGKVRVPLGEDVHHHYILNYDQQHAITIPEVNKGEYET